MLAIRESRRKQREIVLSAHAERINKRSKLKIDRIVRVVMIPCLQVQMLKSGSNIEYYVIAYVTVLRYIGFLVVSLPFTSSWPPSEFGMDR